MKKFVTFIILMLSFMSVFGISFKIFDKKLEPEVDFTSLTYVALGDSITWAMDGTNGGERMDMPYCEWVKKSLQLKSVTNCGISGSMLSKVTGYWAPMCERYNDMPQADIVSVLGGINDYGRYATLGTINDNSKETFYGALNVLASGLKRKYPNSFIFFMTPLKIKSYSGVRFESDELNTFRKAIKDVCAKYDIPVLDTAVLADFSKEFNAVGYSGDGLHPSQDFHKNVLAPVIADFIKTNYKAA